MRNDTQFAARVEERVQARNQRPLPPFPPRRHSGDRDGREQETDHGMTYNELLELDENNVRVGLSKSDRRKLKRRKARGSEAGPECPITREAIKEGERVVELPCNCSGAIFKEDAIMKWLDQSKRCPVCRKDLSSDPN